MKKIELICDYCSKVGKGEEHHFGLPEGWYVLGYHCQRYLACDDWRVTHHFCSVDCMDKAVKVSSSTQVLYGRDRMGYKKHNLYWGAYVAEDGDYIGLNNSHWIVRRHLGENTFTDNSKESGGICLILEDKDKSFWSVMSFLEKDDAKELIKALRHFV